MESVSNLWHETKELKLPNSFLALVKRRWAICCTVAAAFLLVLYMSPWASDYARARAPYQKIPPSNAAFDWANYQQHYPVKDIRPLPTGRPAKVPRIQHRFGWEWPKDKKRRQERQAAVKEAFRHSWKGYRENAWLADELSPESGGLKNNFGGWAATLVDSLDTLWLMGMKSEFEEAVEALGEIDFSVAKGTDTISLFETTIRYLGGFLGAYDISGGKYPILLAKAHEFGDLLYAGFDTPNRMPQGTYHWKETMEGQAQEAMSSTTLASFASYCVEFTRLSQLTGDPKYYDAVARITDELDKVQNITKIPGLWPNKMNGATIEFTGNVYSFAAQGDSAYEYLNKEYLLLGDPSHAAQYQRMYESAIDAATRYMFFRPMTPQDSDILLSGTIDTKQEGEPNTKPHVEHLSCFSGGMLDIGAKMFNRPQDLEIGRKLVDGCIWAYGNTPTGIMAEASQLIACPKTGPCLWNQRKWRSGTSRVDMPGFAGVSDRRYILRPEAIESVFIHYRVSGDKTYQDAAWTMFEAVMRKTKATYGNAALDDCTIDPPPTTDSMESFWLAETLKYYYLIFSEPSLMSLDEYVLNTEAHPFKRPR